MGFLTGTILVIFILTSLFLILLVMIQTGKGGMGSMLGSSSQSPFGSGTADVITNATKYTAIGFMVMSLLLSYLFAKKQSILPETNGSSILQPQEESTDKSQEGKSETTNVPPVTQPPTGK